MLKAVLLIFIHSYIDKTKRERKREERIRRRFKLLLNV